MGETDGSESLLQRKTTRRRFLEGSLKVAVGVGLGLVLGKGHTPESAAALASQIEGRFGIIVDSPGKNIGERPSLTKSNPIIAWDRPRLAIMNGLLENLPPNFYQPRVSEDGNKVPLKLTLLESEGRSALCTCERDVTETPVRYPTIEFMTNVLPVSQDGGVRISKSFMTHELTHYVTIPVLNELIEGICKPIGLDSEEKLAEMFDAKNFTFDPKYRDENEIKLAGHNFQEFFAVAGQFYVEGRDKFLSLYEPILGEEKANILYQGMKQEVFQGFEYQNFR